MKTKTSIEIRSELNNTVSTQLALTESAENESRSFTAAEQTEYNELEARFAQLNIDLADAERREEVKKRAAEIQVRMNRGAGIPSSQPKQRDYMNYSLLRAVRGAISNRLDGFEAEVNQELRAAGAKSGIDYQGVAVPEWAFTPIEKRAILSSGEADALVQQYGGLIEALRNKTIVGSLGARFLNGLTGSEVVMPRVVAGAATWNTEAGAAADAGTTFDNVKLVPKRLAAMIDVSKQFISQSHFSAEAALIEDIVEAMGVALDLAALNGPTGGNSPVGVLNIAGMPTVTFGGSAVAATWAKIVEMEALLGTNNGLRGAVSYLTSYKMMGALKVTKRDAGSGLFLANGMLNSVLKENIEINGYRGAASPHVPDNLTVNNLSGIIMGNWNDLIIGTFGQAGVDLTVDPYTLAINGQIRITTNSYHDINVRRKNSFVVVKDADATP